MKWLRLGLWLLRRERASGEWRVLLLALIVGVGSVSTTGFLGDRLKRGMNERGASFLGADLLVSSPRPVEHWPHHGLRSSTALEFSSMVSNNNAFQLATVRAVDAAYPLRGTVQIADKPMSAGKPRAAQPPAGAIYVDQQLLPLLSVQVGDTVQIGVGKFRIAGVVKEEPGQLAGIFGLAPRVFLRADEVARTQVLLPGSRVTYLYQFAGGMAEIAEFRALLEPRLDNTQRLLGARAGVETLRGAFADTDRYVQLAALTSLLLAVVAIGIAARRHALRHYDQAALLRCFGTTTGQLRMLYAVQLLLIGLLGSALGVALGAIAQQALARLVLPDALAKLPELGAAPVAAAIATGLLGLAGASVPTLLRLSQVPPLRVLRRDLPPLPLAAWVSAVVSGSAFLLVVAWYARDPWLIGVFVGALAALIAALAALARAGLLAGSTIRRLAHGPLRFGLASLLRHRFESSLQLGAFTLALFLIAVMALVRSDLITSWRTQLPADAPNYFLVNIAPDQQQAVGEYLSRHGLPASALYPMVRGRVTTKNGVPIAATLPPEEQDADALRRELNLTWTNALPPNNVLIGGQWHGLRRAAEISVESSMAEHLRLKVGDELAFQVGDQSVAARITSIRRVKWDSLQPNFYVIFAPGQLDALPMSAIASVHVSAATAGALPEFIRTFPGITVIALDKLIANIEAVFAQIVAAIQLMLGFLLAAGIAIVFATLLASLDAREQEAVLLRVLGARRAYLAKGLWSEFIVLGLLAGLLASLCAEAAMAAIGWRLFELPTRLHPWLWLVLPIAGALLVGISGWLATRHVARIPPLRLIRAME